MRPTITSTRLMWPGLTKRLDSPAMMCIIHNDTGDDAHTHFLDRVRWFSVYGLVRVNRIILRKYARGGKHCVHVYVIINLCTRITTCMRRC